MMSGDTVVSPPAGDKGGNGGTYTPPASQDDLNRIIAERVSRERAKYADYDDLKAKAGKFDELAEAQKSEIQRATERADAAEREAAEQRAEALRLRVAHKHGIPADHLDLLSGTDEAALEARAKKVAALITPPAPKGAVGPYVPPEGGIPTGQVGDPATAFADFLNNQLTR